MSDMPTRFKRRLTLAVSRAQLPQRRRSEGCWASAPLLCSEQDGALQDLTPFPCFFLRHGSRPSTPPRTPIGSPHPPGRGTSGRW